MGFKDHALGVIREHQHELTRLGVVHASIFGSVARGNDRPDSDVDVVVEVDPAVVRGLFALGRIQVSLEEWMGRPVDVARRDRLREGVAREVEQEAVHAF